MYKLNRSVTVDLHVIYISYDLTFKTQDLIFNKAYTNMMREDTIK